jgi:ribose/xylose/arabinose/galactoside ABC-type transport system permease subunit
MATEQAPLGEREAARSGRGGGLLGTARGLLIGRPETGALFGAIVMFVFFSLYADHFTTRTSLAGLASITAELGIVSMGVTLLMIAGHFDLSVGSVLGFSSVIGPYLILNYGTSPWVAVLASVGVAITIGLVNGVLVVGTRIPSFIVTLGTLLIWRSLLLRLTEGFPVAVDKDLLVYKIFSYRIEGGFFRGYQVSFLWFLGVLILLSFLLLRTRFGTGSSPRAGTSARRARWAFPSTACGSSSSSSPRCARAWRVSSRSAASTRSRRPADRRWSSPRSRLRSSEAPA